MSIKTKQLRLNWVEAFKALPPASNTIIEKTMWVTNSDQKTWFVSLKFFTFLLMLKFIEEETLGKLGFQCNNMLLTV